jgi:Arc/MetJ-type ribon-helix-helix transcriptional regulator
MRKTTVYLSEDEAEALRRASARLGASQSELIREGVRRITQEPGRRTFHSMAVGRSGGKVTGRDAEEILRRAWDRTS